MRDTVIMDSGQLILVLCRLILGAIASFLAIMLWSRTRDAAWIFVIIATILSYVETIFSILDLFGIGGGNILPEGWLVFVPILLSCLPPVALIAAFTVMVLRKYRRH